MMTDNVKTFFGCAGWFIAAILLFKGCDWYSSYKKEKRNESYIEKMRSDSIRQAFIVDSLAHDPHYQDSIKIEQAKYKKWKEEQEVIDMNELIGFVIDGDSVYHSSFHPINFINEHIYGFMISDRQRLKFVTKDEVISNQLKLCEECDKTEDVRMRYDEGELFDEEEASDHDLILKEDADYYCSHHYGDN